MAIKTKGAVLAVVGAQYGSEGKGVFVHHIADRFAVHVRTGGPNAGHTFVHEGKQWVFQSVPCGWTNKNAMVYIGRGGLVDMDKLVEEVTKIYEVDRTILVRLFIDSDCGVISKWHMEEEGGVDGEMHKRIGSTGKGVGAARRDRLMRKPDAFQRVKDVAHQYGNNEQGWSASDLLVENSPKSLNMWLEKGESILLEGAQGSGLSLIHGPWPYVTSSDTGAAQLAADAGIPPQFVETLLIARTFPIRVAGNSGPLKDELTWEEISARVGRPTTEKTTVTKKTRRIGKWDEELVENAVRLNGATQIAISFMDYLDPASEGITNPAELGETAKAFIRYVAHRFNVTVPLVGVGGEGFRVAELTPVRLRPYLVTAPNPQYALLALNKE